MYSYYFKNCSPLSKAIDLNEKTFLWVFHVDKVPPHIGISSSGIFFSLKVNGKDENISVQKVLKIISKKEINTAIIELRNPIEIKEISCKFSSYTCAGTRTVTCLDPIIKLLNCPSDVLVLSDLLHFSEKNDELVSAYYTGKSKIEGIKAYSIEDIQERLKLLENAER